MTTPEPSQAPQRLLAGAVDLSALSTSRPPAPSGEALEAPSGATVIDVSEATFQAEVLERSMSVPVVIDFWAEWCQPCKQLSPTLEKLAGEGDGTWTLAKIDVDANPQLQAAFQVQSIPMVIAMWQGRPVDGFQGVQPEETLRQWIARLIEATGGEASEAPEAPADPQLVAAESALDSGDLDGAERAFTSFLDNNPGDVAAESGLAQVRLLRRVEAAGPAAQEAVTGDPADIPQALLAADIQVINGRAADAYGQLIELIGRLGGEQRDTVRKHLLELFTVAGPDDPAVADARRKLATVLF